MNAEMFLKYPAVFLASLLTTYVLTALFIRIAPRLKMMDVPHGRHVHKEATPRGGGVAVFAGFHIGCAITFLLPWAPFSSQVSMNWWLCYLLSSFVLLCVGLADDRWGLRPTVKLLGQTGAAIVAFSLGMRMTAVLGVNLPFAIDLLLTVLWLLAIINAFNLIDGLDGLATGLALIGAIGLATSFIFRRLPGDVLVMLALAGSCLAFLRYNFSPARVFLGDSGSMFLGLTIAVMALTTESKGTTITALALPLFAAGVPLFDTVLAIWRRTVRQLGNGAAKEGIAHADLDHLHHRLERNGMSQRRVALALYALSGSIVAVGVLAMIFKSHVLGIALASFVLGTYIVVRHLARVELWDTGIAIVEGLRKPPPRVLSVILYPVLDAIALCLLDFVALFILNPALEMGALKDLWLDHVVIWAGLPFMLMALSRAYRRVWGRARPSEFVLLVVSLAGGILLGAGVYALMTPCGWRALISRVLVYGGLVAPVLVGARAAGQTVLDAVTWRERKQIGVKSGKPVLLLGAGQRALLFLRGLSMSDERENRHYRVEALLDEDANLHGRFVYGYEVLGGIDRLAYAVERFGAHEIVIACELSTEARDQLLSHSQKLGLDVSEWNVQRTELLP